MEAHPSEVMLEEEPSRVRRRIAIMTPIFHTEVGGAAIYYRQLCERLIELGHEVTVISDREEGAFSGAYVGIFPQRNGRDRRPIRDAFNYAIQNLDYFKLPEIVCRIEPDTFLLHSSFLNQPGLFGRILEKMLALEHRWRLVLDVRDQLMPTNRAHLLKHVDAFIACSDNVANHLAACGAPKERVSRIPIPMSFSSPEHAEVDALLVRQGITRERYISCIGAIKHSKGTDLVLDAYRLFQKRFPDISLILAGPLKTRDPKILRALDSSGVRYLGSVSHRESLLLAAGAALCVCLSRSEGMPRSCLEALALSRRVLLPPGVPEFDNYCPEFVVAETDPAAVAAKMEWAVSVAPPSYPIARHDAGTVLAKYEAIL
jgi:glycosyltransferase involved in cell wall biosynthesis